MRSRTIPVEPFDYVVFGGAGDLAGRKLLPALYHRQAAGQFSEPTRIIAAGRSEFGIDDYRAFAGEALRRHHGGETLNDGEVRQFLARLHYLPVDAQSERGWDALEALLCQAKARVRAFYLAVGPALIGDICKRIGARGLAGGNCRIVVEKPVGSDLETARALNDAIALTFGEEQTFRIDHYLGKETVQNLMALRFANAFYEPLWNAAHIDHVQVTVAETVGIEGRGDYYRRAGALRDMVQNHLLQLVCLVAMEAPASIDAEAVRDEKLKVLRAFRRIDAANAARLTARGRYRAGVSDGRAVEGADRELDGAPATETFVALKVEIDNWRWAGTPFYLRTGKRMAERVSEIVIHFKPIPHSIFGATAGAVVANQLVLRLQPDEGVKQWIMIKDPGPGGMRLRHVPLDMSFAERFAVRNPDAYERLLMDVIRCNRTLFMRRDEVEAAWRWIDPILHAWEETEQPCQVYAAGTAGPANAIALIERDGRTWHESGAGAGQDA